MSTCKLVFEIGTEEIPAMPLYAATRDLATAAEAALDEARIAHGEVVTYSTPRRMILVVDDLADASEALSMRAKGPAAAIAFDDDGNPTKAAEGFAPAPEEALEVNFPAELLEKVPQEQREALRGVLSCDPRPRYQDDPRREYGMAFGGLNVNFTVAGDILTVTGVERERET